MINQSGQRVRLARSITVTVLAAGGIVAVAAAPAQAGPWCHDVRTISYNAGRIQAASIIFCGPRGGADRDGHDVIQRKDPTTGVWTTVMTGTGVIWYTCTGTSTHEFRNGTTPTPVVVTAPCY